MKEDFELLPHHVLHRAWWRRALTPTVYMIAGLCCAFEIVFILSDAGLIGSERWRSAAYGYGAFWRALLQGWPPVYEAQPYTMFLTYGFLHSDFSHLLGNLIAFVVLARVVQARAGQGGLLLLYVLSLLGGALCFGVLHPGSTPMVGASGAIFGLAGAWLYWLWHELRLRGHGTYRVWRAVLAMILMNFLMWVLNGGHLAWETHLGGALAGWLGAVIWTWQSSEH